MKMRQDLRDNFVPPILFGEGEWEEVQRAVLYPRSEVSEVRPDPRLSDTTVSSE